MDIYKKASKLDLRIPSNKGIVSVSKLWTMSIDDLDQTAIALKKQLKESETESFVKVNVSVQDKTTKLCFDIVLDVLETKVRDQETAAKAAETRAHNQKILSLIKSKQDEELLSKSAEELEAMLK